MSIRPSTVVDEYIKLKPFQVTVRHQKKQFHFFLIYCFYCTSSIYKNVTQTLKLRL